MLILSPILTLASLITVPACVFINPDHCPENEYIV